MKSGMENYRGYRRPYGAICWLRIATLEMESMTIIGVYLTANDNSNESKLEHKIDINELSSLIEKLKNENKDYLIVGDFNSDPIRNKTFDRELLHMVKEMELKFFDIEYDNKNKHMYTNGIHSSAIDHVIGPKHLVDVVQNVKIYQTDPINLSDHLPLISELKIKINNPKKRETKRKGIKKINWNDMNRLNNGNRIVHKYLLDETINALHSSMLQIKSKISKKQLYAKKKSKVWWDENFEKIHSEMNYQLWMYKASNYKVKNSKIRKKSSETEKRFIKLLNNCSEIDKFWKLVNKQVEIHRENVIKIIKNLPNNKSIGFGEINNELYKYGLSNLLIELVATIIEKVINSGIIPNFFNFGKISPVVKDEKKAKNDVNNIRPITISDTLANIYERLIMIELDKSHNGVPNQFGFTYKRFDSSCNHAVFALNETILHTIKKDKPVYACAIDASKAFDKVNRTILFNKLIGKIHPKVWNSLKNYYDSSLAYVVNQGEISEIFKTTV
ncbi:RNA-directed DNA polymerase from mobile element jockey-like [Brachionus plicatilis]|uniref:RNA-directed DNA polymerase from mobile element jockey-like n=1 Tax=Brachionus plicatilis TaxID=10195 RepID=A0A3M7QEY1_BRAPC|nr:RNA-directed DNA polymerase from mobile element jockey-like [Brachionus plicatilis]